jgi:hypothetical protein
VGASEARLTNRWMLRISPEHENGSLNNIAGSHSTNHVPIGFSSQTCAALLPQVPMDCTKSSSESGNWSQ